jgi:CheY-specific phosphatase CheX
MEFTEIQTALSSAVEEVLETMFFASVVDSAEGAAPREAGVGTPDITAAIKFEGNPSGRFRVSVPTKLARVLGASFLGREEEEVTDSQAGEVVSELANMICGSVLSRLEREAIFQIGHPELSPPESGAGPQSADGCRQFDLGDGVLTATLQLRRPA